MLLLAGCETQPTEMEDYQLEPVLNAYLVNGEPVNQIFLQWTAPLQGYYTLNTLGISDQPDCEMKIRVLDGAEAGKEYFFKQHDSPDSTWIYVPRDADTLRPQSRVHYRIEVRKPSEKIDVWAETVVPGTFDLGVNGIPVNVFPANTNLTREDPNILLNWSIPDSVGGFVIITRALTDLYSIVPLDPEFEIGVDTVDHAEASLVSYWMCRYDQILQPVPWMLFSWAGPTTVEMQAAAPGYNDYVTSLWRASMGFPIEYVSNVHGGIGIFGGLSRKKFEVVMERVQ
jgi:hypothetical protein